MTEPFELPVTYKGKELLLPAQMIPWGYTYRIQVEVEGQTVFFERDEERHLRGIIEHNDKDQPKFIDPALIQAVADAIEAIS